MNRAPSLFLHLASLSLEAAERSVVLGDLAESNAGLLESLLSILGLAARRQLALWRDWQPWLALLGIAGLTAGVLSARVFDLDMGISMQLRTYLKYGVRYEMGVSADQDIASIACQFLAIVFWCWAGGFTLGALSRRAAWLTGTVFYIVVCLSWFAHHLLFDRIQYAAGHDRAPLPVLLLLLLAPVRPVRIAVLLAAGFGAVSGLKRKSLSFAGAWTAAVAAFAVFILLLWTGNWYQIARPGLSNGVWRPEPWLNRLLPLFALSWPAAYISAISRLRRSRSVRSSN